MGAKEDILKRLKERQNGGADLDELGRLGYYTETEFNSAIRDLTEKYEISHSHRDGRYRIFSENLLFNIASAINILTDGFSGFTIGNVNEEYVRERMRKAAFRLLTASGYTEDSVEKAKEILVDKFFYTDENQRL